MMKNGDRRWQKRAIGLLLCSLALSMLTGCGIVIDGISAWNNRKHNEKRYSGRINSKESEKRTNDMMDQVLEALNAGDTEQFLSLFAEPVREANPDIEALAEEAMNLYQGTGRITDNSYYGEEKHTDRGSISFFGDNLYRVETEVTNYRIAIGTYLVDDFDRSMEGLFVFQIWEDGYTTGQLVRQGIKSDGGIFIYHCNTMEQLEELPHLLVPDDKEIRTSDLPQKRRETLSIAMQDAGLDRTDPLTTRAYIDYYDEVPVSYNWEFESYDGMYYLYRFDLETMEIIDHISYPIIHPEYID